MAILYIGNNEYALEAMPDPKLQGLTVLLQDLDSENSTRTASGRMVRDRIAGGATAKRKLQVEWPAMHTEDMQRILQAIAGSFFWVRYPDPFIGGFRTAEFYAGDRTAPIYGGESPEGLLWEGLEVNMIER